MSDPDRHDDLFDVVPFEHKHDDGPQVLFLVKRRRDGHLREIVVRADEQGFYEFTVDQGEGHYDVEAEPLYLTNGLMAHTAKVLGHARRVNQMADATVAAVWMLRASGPGLVN